MAQDRALQLLQQGMAAAKAGQSDQARQILQQAVRLDPQNETIWLWLTSVARDNQERAFCLKQILTINPQNEMALQGLKRLGIDLESKPSEPASSVPMIAPEKLPAIQTAVDNYLRSYNPKPQTVLEVEWVHKEGRRFGEAAAARRSLRQRALRYSLIGIVMLAAVGGVIALLTLSGDETQTTAMVPTLTPSWTATNTPTATPGIPNTPTPDGANPLPEFQPPTVIAAVRGNIYGGTPTPVYPEINAAVRSNRSGTGVEDSLRLLQQGDYEAVLANMDTLITSQSSSCYAETYYYAALALAEQGGAARLDDAEARLQEALQRGSGGRQAGVAGINTCNESPLLYAGLCYVEYKRGISDSSAIDSEAFRRGKAYCSQSIELSTNARPPQAPIPQASLSLARMYILEGDFGQAASVLDAAIERRTYPTWPGHVDLLLARADAELGVNNPQQALEYIDRALYVSPRSAEALEKRVRTWLQLADSQTSDADLRILRYGTAAVYAEAYLLYYPGEPVGHILLAEARLKEGNPDRALNSLNQVINVAETLPPEAAPLIRDAFALRLAILTQQRDWQGIYADLEQLRTRYDPDNLEWLFRQVSLALTYPELEFQTNQTLLNNIDTLLADDPARTNLILAKARLLTRTCQEATADLSCDYAEVANNILTDEFLATLSGIELADALSYRTEADFALLLENATEEAPLETSAIEPLLARLQQALTVRETAADYYLLGRLLSASEQPAAALNAYQYVLYWSQFYAYPFTEDVQDAVETLTETLEESGSEST